MDISSPEKTISNNSEFQFTKPKYEIADILELYLDDFLKEHNISPDQVKVIYNILNCRTAAYGFHKLVCDNCEHERIEYNSCRNRHCPKCQGATRLKWVDKRLEELLPIPYYHAVFTLVHSLNTLALYNKEIIYDIFLKAAGRTLQDFALDPKFLGAKIGLVGILHTWGQPLCQHIHAHFIVPGGGISVDGSRWINLPYRKKFLFPVKAMSKRMRNLFSKALQQAYDDNKLVFPDELSHLKNPNEWKRFLNKVSWEDWINYVKKPFSSPEDVVKYIGRYTHRVAISNHRILDIEDGVITFRYKKYNGDSSTQEIMKLDAVEFIRRFLLHVLPKGFKKIRYFGLLSSGLKKKSIELARELLNVSRESCKQIESCYIDLIEKLKKCPDCESGILQLIEVIDPRKPHLKAG